MLIQFKASHLENKPTQDVVNEISDQLKEMVPKAKYTVKDEIILVECSQHDSPLIVGAIMGYYLALGKPIEMPHVLDVINLSDATEDLLPELVSLAALVSMLEGVESGKTPSSPRSK
jgi:hypothetical protein